MRKSCFALFRPPRVINQTVRLPRGEAREGVRVRPRRRRHAHASLAWHGCWMHGSPSVWRVETGDRLGESPPRPLPCLLTQRASQHTPTKAFAAAAAVASFSLRGCAFLCVTAAAAAAAIAELVSSYGNKCKRIMSREGGGTRKRSLLLACSSLPCSARRRCETDVQFASLFLFHG